MVPYLDSLPHPSPRSRLQGPLPPCGCHSHYVPLALPTACHAPMQAPALAAELRAHEAWLPSQAVKVGKLETEINPQSCSVVKVAAGRPSTQQPRSPATELSLIPLNTHIYTQGGSGDRIQETIGPAGPDPPFRLAWGSVVVPALPGPDLAIPGLPLSPYLHDNRILRMLQPPQN